MWQSKRVSVALPTYNEKASIRECIEAFFATGVVDEVVVCNNNAAEGTSDEVVKTRAREVFETRQGYGWSCQKALRETTGDLIVLAEPEGSFEPADIIKLLAYSTDFEVVLCTRTTSELIWTGANMGFFMKWANWGRRQVHGVPLQHGRVDRRRVHDATHEPQGARADPTSLQCRRVSLWARDDAALDSQWDEPCADPRELQAAGWREHGLWQPLGRVQLGVRMALFITWTRITSLLFGTPLRRSAGSLARPFSD